MSRIDWVVLRRLAGTASIAVVVMFSLFMLLDSLDTGRFKYMMELGGLPLALTSLAASAGRWTIRTLSVTVLTGTIVGILDLQTRHEMNIIRATGASIWHVVRAPLIAAVLVGIVVSLFVETATAELDRKLNPSLAAETGALTSDGALWLEQADDLGRYIMRAGRVQPGAQVLDDVTMFLYGEHEFARIIAPQAQLMPGAWYIPRGVGYRADARPTELMDFQVPTGSSPTDIQVRLSSTDDLTFFELAAALAGRISDPILASAITTRFMRLATLPLMMAGSILIAFAFTAGYRRTNKYGGAVLYGIVLGFVVFFVTEMADRAGSAGALNPTFAAVGPAFVAIVVGVTVLLYREDGRA